MNSSSVSLLPAILHFSSATYWDEIGIVNQVDYSKKWAWIQFLEHPEYLTN
jgi:hypothetical protein